MLAGARVREIKPHPLQPLILLDRARQGINAVAIDIARQKDDRNRTLIGRKGAACIAQLFRLHGSLSERRSGFTAIGMDEACCLSIPEQPDLRKAQGNGLKTMAV